MRTKSGRHVITKSGRRVRAKDGNEADSESESDAESCEKIYYILCDQSCKGLL